MANETEITEVAEISVTDLLAEAQSGLRKLLPRERRRVIAFINDAGVKDAATGDAKDFTNYELASLFQVDEKIIRNDKRKLLKEYTKLITPDDAMTFIGTFMQGHDDLLRRTLQSIKKMESLNMSGTLTHAKYIALASDLHKRRVGMLQEIGAIPKELGNLNVNEENWEAYIVDSGDGNAASGVRRIQSQIGSGVLDEDGETIEASCGLDDSDDDADQ